MQYDVALVVGHRRSSQGAAGHGTTEWLWWSQQAQVFAGCLGEAGLHVAVFHRKDRSDGYDVLPSEVNQLDPLYCLSLHLNGSDDPLISGSETLYARGSRFGALGARNLQEASVPVLGLRDRGPKPLLRRHRGGWLLHGTRCPANIWEPGFITCQDDLDALGRAAASFDLWEASTRAVVDTVRAIRDA